MKRKLVAAIACRNQGSRLYGKPLQNLDVKNGIKIIDNIISCLKSFSIIDEIVLGISEGVENKIFRAIAKEKKLKFVFGDQIDVLSRLIKAGEISDATDIFRVTSESPFLYFDKVEELWIQYQTESLDAIFMDEVIDGCGFEIISLEALRESHKNGNTKHRSELCTLYIRENPNQFKVKKVTPPSYLIRKDLRLTVDNPEDLVVCRAIYNEFSHLAPRIPIDSVVTFLDDNPKLKELTFPFTEVGYSTMYI
jgi:spore coat polysaccharide biosynthesis protein SpsF